MGRFWCQERTRRPSALRLQPLIVDTHHVALGCIGFHALVRVPPPGQDPFRACRSRTPPFFFISRASKAPPHVETRPRPNYNDFHCSNAVRLAVLGSERPLPKCRPAVSLSHLSFFIQAALEGLEHLVRGGLRLDCGSSSTSRGLSGPVQGRMASAGSRLKENWSHQPQHAPRPDRHSPPQIATIATDRRHTSSPQIDLGLRPKGENGKPSVIRSARLQPTFASSIDVDRGSPCIQTYAALASRLVSVLHDDKPVPLMSWI